MKFLAFATVLILVTVATSNALQCSLLPQTVCDKINAVGDAMTNAVTQANDALAVAVKEALSQATDLYTAGLKLIKATLQTKVGQLTDKLNKLKAILDDKLAVVSKAQKAVIDKAIAGIQKAQEKVQEAIQKAVVNANRNDTKATAAVASAFHMTAGGATTTLDDVRREISAVITGAAREANEIVRSMKLFVDEMLRQTGASPADIRYFSQNSGFLLDSIEHRAGAVAEAKTSKAVSNVIDKAVSLMDDIEAHTRSRRSVTDLWTKVKDSLSKLGKTVSDRVKQVFEQKKPEIIQALKDVGKVLVDTGKTILIELTKDVVTAIISQPTGPAQPTY